MSLVLNNTAGSASANAYVSLSTCSTFLERDIHRYSTWSSVSTANQTACIIMSTSLIDVQMDFKGTKGSSTQSLEFPRDYLYDKSGYAITSTDIPTDIQIGCSFYAYFLSQNDRVGDSDTFGFSRLDAGSLRMDIDKYDRRPTMPNIVWDYLKWFGTKTTSPSRTLVRK